MGIAVVGTMIGKYLGIRPEERLKVALLSLIYFFLIAGYTVTRDLKNSIFISIVGKSYIPLAKIASLVFLIPAILFYSKLVDRVRRYQLLYYYSIFFGVSSLIFAYFIGHPEIGIANTNRGAYRLLGWLFYFFVEGYSPFMVSVFWSFANSITGPEDAKKNYGPMVAGSKLGGMFSAAVAWYLFSISGQAASDYFNDVNAHRIIMGLSAACILAIPAVIVVLMKYVPGYELHGYEAAYKLEKVKAESTKEGEGMFAGLKVFVQYPYVLGILGIILFYETISSVLDYLRLGAAESGATSVSDMSRLLFEMMFKTHAAGLVISLIGTGALLNRLGTKLCLLLVPLMTGSLLIYLMFETSPEVLVNVFVVYKSMHYAFSLPVRESLYIPTVKEIKFKSKSWIDSFGSKLAKAFGSGFNMFASQVGTAFLLPIHSMFFVVMIGGWFITSFFLGRRFEQAIADNEVIGLKKGLHS